MSKCGWTKYGRTAKISFNNNKSNIDTIIRNENKYSTIHYDWINTKRFINEQYTGDTKTIEDIVDSFNSIFESDPENMRYSAYKFGNDDYILSQEYLTEPIIPLNTKPFQKREIIGGIPGQYQMPAYFMQYLAFVMHDGFNILGQDIFDLNFLLAKFNKKYSSAQQVLIRKKDIIQPPHYLETYYLLTKSVSIIDFY